MLTGQMPFISHSHNAEMFFMSVKYGDYAAAALDEYDVSEAARDLIAQLLTPDPTKRPFAHGVIDHPWFDSVRSLGYCQIGSDKMPEMTEDRKSVV